MKTIVFYSKTGNTKTVAKEIAQKLNIESLEIIASSDDPNQIRVTLLESPDLTSFDDVILGSPVHGFSIPKIMRSYLDSFQNFKDKTFYLFVTHYFPFPFLGGNQCLKQIKKLIESKQGTVKHMASIEWKSKKKDIKIRTFIERI